MKAKKHGYSSAFKAKVGLEALQDRKSIGDLALEYKVSAYKILDWKKESMYRVPELSGKTSEYGKPDAHVEKLYSRISRLEKEKDLYKSNLEKFGL